MEEGEDFGKQITTPMPESETIVGIKHWILFVLLIIFELFFPDQNLSLYVCVDQI